MTRGGLTVTLPVTATDAALRICVASALAVDAVVHWDLAEGYGIAFPAGIGGEAVFRIEAVVAVVVAVLVVATGSRPAWALAFGVLASAFAAVILYRYVEVPQIGPIPSMYEPIWFSDKAVSAIAEGIGATLAMVGLATYRRSHHPVRTATP